MLSPAEKRAVLAALKTWVSISSDVPKFGFLSSESLMTPAQLYQEVIDGTSDGEALLGIIEFVVRRKGLQQAVALITAEAAAETGRFYLGSYAVIRPRCNTAAIQASDWCSDLCSRLHGHTKALDIDDSTPASQANILSALRGRSVIIFLFRPWKRG